MNTLHNIDKVKKALLNVTATDLVYNRTTKSFDEIQVSPTIIERDRKLLVSAEDGIFADYYGDFRDGCPWIDGKLEQLAEKNGFYWEWENTGCICLAER